MKLRSWFVVKAELALTKLEDMTEPRAFAQLSEDEQRLLRKALTATRALVRSLNSPYVAERVAP